MVGNSVEQIKVTSDDLVNQLVKYVAALVVDVSALRAENEKLKSLINAMKANSVEN
jgi:regulator of replication initiation timing